MSLAHDRLRRRQLAEKYAEARRKHAPRAGVAQQLKRLTHRLLRNEVAEEKAAAKRAARAGDGIRSLAADLDLFATNHG
ncbi:hypothetical protein KHC23_12905 [Ancylobacter dichloromethanicus]|uniref:Uncharacterized protein n=1 Tax=Ancylobacter dichloromethanicus TaxID=518825 RepID=A0A9W6MZ62_9HYPH|nr:hypothetical protein [Ancylobacter dichloromethanicus]MBS7554552.1 hypothetical protein [Ancylobacter dichloromethanicus]GLK71682.1 hypothetical protein GCM10017643_17970 [Ancylobacter dichloromethanicus]